MQGIDLRNAERVEDALLDHDPPAADRFLGRLEDQRHTALEIAGFGQISRRTQQYRRMTVVAAGMGNPRSLAGVGNARRFMDRQCIHIGTQADGGSCALSFDDRNDTAGCDTFVDFRNAEFAQLADHEGGGLMALQAQLRMRVEMLPPGRHIRGKVSDPIDDGHGSTVRWFRCDNDPLRDSGARQWAMI